MSVVRRLLGLGERRASPGGLGSLDGNWTATGHSISTAGTAVSVDTAMRVATFYACVKVISEDIASLPLELMETYSNGKVRPAINDPDYEVFTSGISDDTTNFTFWQAYVQAALITGGAFAGIIRHPANGTLQSMFPIHPAWVYPMRKIPNPNSVPDFAAGIAYQVRVPTYDVVYLFAGDTIMPMPLMSRNGITGSSPLADQRDTLGLALAQDNYAAMLMVNGAKPTGVLSTEHTLNEAEFEQAKEQWKANQAGAQNGGKTLILPYNMKYSAISMTSNDIQYMDTRKMTREDICAIFRVPLHMVGIMDHATFSNIEQQALNYVTNTLRPLCVAIEQTMNRFALRDSQRKAGKFLKFNLDDLERGDRLTRFQAYNTGVLTGVLTRNECRKAEGLNPMPGADTLLVPLNMGIQTGAPLPVPIQQPKPDPALPAPAPGDPKKPAAKTPAPVSKKSDPLIMTYTVVEDPATRDQERIKSAFRELAKDAFDRIVRKEVQEISKSVRKFNAKQLSDWAPGFIGDMRSFYAAQLSPVLTRAASSVCDLNDTQRDLIANQVEQGAHRYVRDTLGALHRTLESDPRAEAFDRNVQRTLADWAANKAATWAADEIDTIFELVEV